jgi:hypothetical protein
MSDSSVSSDDPLPRWLARFKSTQTTCLRLFCFPYAGGGATAYHPWVTDFPASIGICAIKLPGRESRIGEAPHKHLIDLLPLLALVIATHPDIPFAFIGHSMGPSSVLNWHGNSVDNSFLSRSSCLSRYFVPRTALLPCWRRIDCQRPNLFKWSDSAGEGFPL